MSCSADLKLLKSETGSLTLKCSISKRVFVAIDTKEYWIALFLQQKGNSIP